MKRYAKDDERMTNAARKFRAGAAVCVFGLVGAVWLQAELYADQMNAATGSAAMSAPIGDATIASTPDAENPSATLGF